MDDVNAIAEGLSEAKIAFLLSLPADGSWRRTTEGEFNAHGPNALRGFGQSGLIEGYYRGHMAHRLTPLGINVLNHLLSTRGDSGAGEGS
jgi:hypothetical protein